MGEETFCPSTMCPLIAPKGSPWTGQVNAKCIGKECGWYRNGGCMGQAAAFEQVKDVKERGFTLQMGPGGNKFNKRKPIAYDCTRANDCQWQREQKDGSLCPPRQALLDGLDPRVCLY